jgi:uncharacterized protein
VSSTPRDPEGAKSLLRAEFGWEIKTVDFGSGDFRWFSLPGYGAYLQEHDPELRDRLEEDSAPEGFEDAVAWFVPVDDDTPPHWSITLAVDDADATSERAAELGRPRRLAALSTPRPSGCVRMTVIRDPQGRCSRRASTRRGVRGGRCSGRRRFSRSTSRTPSAKLDLAADAQ